MASLEQDYEADMSRRGADTLDMSRRFIRESPTRADLLRACDLEARRKGLASMLVDELASISLADNSVSVLQAPFFYSLLSLQSLDLSHNRLKTLPSEIGGLGLLRILKLQGNRLESLPPDIGKLGKLELVDASFNRLDRLPPEILLASRLKVLLAKGNKLVSLPEPPREDPDVKADRLAKMAASHAASVVSGTLRAANAKTERGRQLAEKAEAEEARRLREMEADDLSDSDDSDDDDNPEYRGLDDVTIQKLKA